MTPVSSAPDLSSTKLSLAPGATDREKLAATAKQFEAIFMRQMLAAARKADFGGEKLLGGADSGGGALDTFGQMQDDHFADVTAQGGTLGFAAQIEAQLARFLPSSATPKASATPKTGAE